MLDPKTPLPDHYYMFSNRYSGARILLTGDTGFKGTWIAYWLTKLGATVHGLALPPDHERALYRQAKMGELITHVDGDIRDLATVEAAYARVQPDLVIHMAAQALVRESYNDPLGTMMSNVMGTAHVCDALRRSSKACGLLIITSDKCYANNEWVYGYRENDPMGGSDPYSASKGIAELVTASWRKSFFPIGNLDQHRKPLATARAGNVIGPGDWAADRIVPDAVRALSTTGRVMVRNPHAIRPWQHVLEPLSGYLALGEKLLSPGAGRFAEGWNFGPLPSSTRTVAELVKMMVSAWGSGTWDRTQEKNAPPESNVLRLAIDKAEAQLEWCPVWNFDTTIKRTVAGYARLLAIGNDPSAVRALLDGEIDQYARDARLTHLSWPKC